jgi:hypothetical protein
VERLLSLEGGSYETALRLQTQTELQRVLDALQAQHLKPLQLPARLRQRTAATTGEISNFGVYEIGLFSLFTI